MLTLPELVKRICWSCVSEKASVAPCALLTTALPPSEFEIVVRPVTFCNVMFANFRFVALNVPRLTTLAVPPRECFISRCASPATMTGSPFSSNTPTILPAISTVPVASLVSVDALKSEAVMVRVPRLAILALPTDDSSNTSVAPVPWVSTGSSASRSTPRWTLSSARACTISNVTAPSTAISLSPAFAPPLKASLPPL
ncbi:hypothetical protein PHO31112_05400 [Pandoraea horticolens]|uniref:Uncharacterized protein n=1 Tax=Pandoraea horticolens TaxID=2508298 RepID=A0A5E4ZEV5_9BURK|nr:hypothetical protein PHO31112_05400 [Pandoraea horticolens]